jgi:hypothetical protein
MGFTAFLRLKCANDEAAAAPDKFRVKWALTVTGQCGRPEILKRTLSTEILTMNLPD